MMMELFLRVKHGSSIDKTMRTEKEEKRKFWAFYKVFKEQHGIEADGVYIEDDLGITPTNADKEKFVNQLKKDMKCFKVNSEINKAYKKGIKENDINIGLAIGVGLWGYGIMVMQRSSTSKMYDVDTDTYYFSIETEEEGLMISDDDFEEIKGSEWHVIKEHIQAKQ